MKPTPTITLSCLALAAIIAAYANPPKQSNAAPPAQVNNAASTPAPAPVVACVSCECNPDEMLARIATLEAQIEALQAEVFTAKSEPTPANHFPDASNMVYWTDSNDCERRGTGDARDQWFDGSRWREFADRPIRSVLTGGNCANGQCGTFGRGRIFGRR